MSRRVPHHCYGVVSLGDASGFRGSREGGRGDEWWEREEGSKVGGEGMNGGEGRKGVSVGKGKLRGNRKRDGGKGRRGGEEGGKRSV